MLEDISAFCAIAKYQSFAKAARELGVSTPVVTRRLARLENSLEVRLLNRTTRQVSLTDAGQVFFTEVSEVLQALEASKENVKLTASQISGTLKVALPSSLNECYVIPALSDFLKKYPQLRIELMSGGHLNLLNNGYDLVILCGQLPHSSFYYKKLHTTRKIICASPDYLKQYGTPKKLDDLRNHNCLGVHDHFQSYWKVKDKGEEKEILVSGNVQVNNGIDLKNLAVSGAGIVYVPAYLVYDEINSGRLVSILDQYQSADYSLYAVYPAKKYLAKKTQVFLNFIEELLIKQCSGDSNVKSK